jgi:hypothetical protein
MKLTEKEYLQVKSYLKKTNPKCDEYLIEDIFHNLLIKNKGLKIENLNTYYHKGFRLALLNVDTNQKNGVRLAKEYQNMFKDYNEVIYSDNKLFVKVINQIERLNGKTKKRVKEYLFGEMTISEIAKERNLNYDTTKATIKRGLDILRNELKNVK